MIENVTLVGVYYKEVKVESDKIKKFTITVPNREYDSKEKKYVTTTDYVNFTLSAEQGKLFTEAIPQNTHVILRGDVRVRAYLKDGEARYALELDFPRWSRLPKVFEKNEGASSSGSGRSTGRAAAVETVVEDYDDVI